MYKYLDKKFILVPYSGICHDLSHITKNCQIYKINLQNVFNSNLLSEEIEKHPDYIEKCIYCMKEYL